MASDGYIADLTAAVLRLAEALQQLTTPSDSSVDSARGNWTYAPRVHCPECQGLTFRPGNAEDISESAITVCAHCGAKLSLLRGERVVRWQWVAGSDRVRLSAPKRRC